MAMCSACLVCISCFISACICFDFCRSCSVISSRELSRAMVCAGSVGGRLSRKEADTNVFKLGTMLSSVSD